MTTKKAYVIGTNVSSSLSPAIFEYWFKKYNVNARYNYKEIKEENFDKEIRLLRNEKDLVGFNITIPYKEKIENYLDDSFQRDWGAGLDGAKLPINCVSVEGQNFWNGTNTDWEGAVNTYVSFEEKIEEHKSKRVAYDVCPVNIVLNYLAEQKGYLFDESGNLARSGKLSEELFQQLNDLPFYKMNPPKSLGLEWVKKEVFPLLKSSTISIEDQLHTITTHVAIQLSNQFNKDSNVLVTGGGAYNSYLMERINNYKTINLIIPSPELIEYKEALIFALLGILKLRNENNCLKSVTGAKKNHSSGAIFFPKNQLEKE